MSERANGKSIRYSEWTDEPSSKVAEAPGTRSEVIPFVTREEAERIFSSQRLMSWEEKKRQIDRSLGRSE